MSPLPALNTPLLSRSEFSPFQLPMALLASLARTFRGRRRERRAMIINKAAKSMQFCLYNVVHARVGRQAAISSESSHRALWKLFSSSPWLPADFFFFFLAKVPAALPLFILLIAARGRKEIISLGSCSLVSRWCILICSGYFTAAYSHHWADSQTGEQTAALGTLFLSHPQAEPASGLWAQGPAKQRSSRRQASLLFRILPTELSLANQSPHGNQGTPRYKG